MIWLLSLLLGCAPNTETCDDPDANQVGVITNFVFARADEGVSYGFDLDGLNSAEDGSDGCGVADYQTPDGATGVDNALARLIPALELTEAVAAEDLVQLAINSGELLLMIEMLGVDDLAEDECVSLELFRGSGQPQIGTHGRINDGQTFDRNAEVQPTGDTELVISEGGVTAQNLTVSVPLKLFDADLVIVIENASLHVDYNDDGSFSGYVGGALDYWVIIDMAMTSNVDQALANLLPSLFESNADLSGPDGSCSMISATFEFEGVSAFVFDDAAGP